MAKARTIVSYIFRRRRDEPMLYPDYSRGYLLTDKFKTLIKIAVALGAITGFVGVYLSYYLDGTTGGVIVTLQTLLFLLAFLFSPKYGLISQKRRKVVDYD